MITKNELREELQYFAFHEVTCLDCDNWNNREDKCNKFNCKPPAIIIVGKEKCPNFMCELPF